MRSKNLTSKRKRSLMTKMTKKTSKKVLVSKLRRRKRRRIKRRKRKKLKSQKSHPTYLLLSPKFHCNSSMHKHKQIKNSDCLEGGIMLSSISSQIISFRVMEQMKSSNIRYQESKANKSKPRKFLWRIEFNI